MRWTSLSNPDKNEEKFPAGNFSWSLSRRKLFAFCQRAYFYCYYGAADGWDDYAPAPRRLLYKLKHLRRAEDWAVELFAAAVRNHIQQNQPGKYFDPAVAAPALGREIYRLYRAGCFDIMAENWRKDRKAIHLFEIHYGLQLPNREERVLEYVRRRTAQLAAQWRQQPLFELLGKLSPLELKFCSPPVELMLGDLSVWLAPTLIWREEDRLRVLAVRGGTAHDPTELALSAGLFQLLAGQSYRVQPEQVDITYYFTGTPEQPPEILTTIPPLSQPEIIAVISADTHRMLDKVLPGNLVREKDFPLADDGEKTCAECRFQEFCHSGKSITDCE